MKRLCSILMLLCLLLPATALASGVAYDAGADTLTIRCDEGLAGEEYALFLLKSGVSASSMTSADVLFVDRLTADDSGVVEAVFVSPQ